MCGSFCHFLFVFCYSFCLPLLFFRISIVNFCFDVPLLSILSLFLYCKMFDLTLVVHTIPNKYCGGKK